MFFIFAGSRVHLPGQDANLLYTNCTEYSETAKTAYRELQSSYPDTAYALALLAEAKFQNNHYPEALELYRKAASQMNLLGLHAAMSSVYLALNNPAKAEEETKAERIPDCASEKLACDFGAAHYQAVLLQASSLTGAEQLYWKARAARELADQFCNSLTSGPESTELHRKNARDLESRSKFRDAAAEWRRALQLSPADRTLQNALAKALFLSQDYKAVLPELEALLKSQPDSANLSFFVGDALYESELVEEAIPYLEHALTRNASLLPAQVALGLCYAKLGEAAKAIPHLEAGLPLDQAGTLYYQLSRAYQSTGKHELARAMMSRYQEKQKASGTNGPAQ